MRIGYARVSTRDQEGSLAGQNAALAAAGCSRVFHDRLSGARADRPGLAEALAYLRDGEDVLVVARLDRLGRSLPDALRTVKELADRGIGLEALDVQLDTSTASGKMMLTLLLALAEWERDLLRERTMEGVARARAAGRQPGPKPKLDEERTATVLAAVSGGQPVAAVARVRGQPADDLQGAGDGEGAATMSGHTTGSAGCNKVPTSVGEAVERARAELATYLRVPEFAIPGLETSFGYSDLLVDADGYLLAQNIRAGTNVADAIRRAYQQAGTHQRTRRFFDARFTNAVKAKNITHDLLAGSSDSIVIGARTVLMGAVMQPPLLSRQKLDEFERGFTDALVKRLDQ